MPLRVSRDDAALVQDTSHSYPPRMPPPAVGIVGAERADLHAAGGAVDESAFADVEPDVRHRPARFENVSRSPGPAPSGLSYLPARARLIDAASAAGRCRVARRRTGSAPSSRIRRLRPGAAVLVGRPITSVAVAITESSDRGRRCGDPGRGRQGGRDRRQVRGLRRALPVPPTPAAALWPPPRWNDTPAASSSPSRWSSEISRHRASTPNRTNDAGTRSYPARPTTRPSAGERARVRRSHARPDAGHGVGTGAAAAKRRQVQAGAGECAVAPPDTSEVIAVECRGRADRRAADSARGGRVSIHLPRRSDRSVRRIPARRRAGAVPRREKRDCRPPALIAAP